jgi:sugar O-acyltransferase (sialic acid O-acetyltransferase NeuD family)
MKRLIIIGSGGHGREVAEIVRHQIKGRTDIRLEGFVDDNPKLHGNIFNGLPVLGDLNLLKDLDRSTTEVICAIGSPPICRRIVQKLQSIKISFFNAISPLSYITSFATLGRGVTLFPLTAVSTNVEIGDYSIVNIAATISHDTKIGPYCNINPGAQLAGNVTVGEGCYIGMGAKIIQGISIGPWTVVGAGAAVVRDLPANVTAVGVPARVIKTKEEFWFEK